MNPHERHYLTTLFEPRSVAVIGATERQGRIGEVLIANMLAAGYWGRLFAINPKYSSVRGVACFASVAALPEAVDLAVISTPADTVPGLIDECGRAGIRAVLVITAGFGETGPRGAALEARVLENARRHGVRVVGPNCLGILRPEIGLNAAFARGVVLPGAVGLVSQSGAVCTAMLDWAAPNRIGFSSVISLGGSTDIDFGEIIDYLAADLRTEQILLYIEGIRDARRFMSSLRAAARAKPVILMKVGRHPAGSRAAVSHTGAIVGLDDVFDAAVRRAGVVRVRSVGELVAAGQALASRIRPAGKRLAVITNGGGPGVMAADRAGDLGLPLASLSAATLEVLRIALPVNWSHGNPVDLIGDADSARYRTAVSACLADPGVDGVLVILAPQAITDAGDAARAVIEAVAGSAKPVIACWMGEASVAAARTVLAGAGIPVFRTPEPAVQMFAHISSFYDNQRSLLQVAAPLTEQAPADVAAAARLIAAALAAGRTLLNEAESKQVLAAFHIPVAQATTAHSVEEALALAAGFGFPVALKIDSPDIIHKSEVNGVRLDLISAEALRNAFEEMLRSVAQERPQARINGISVEPMVKKPNGRELFLGVIRDPVFGPAIAFGLGGTAVEVHRDRSIALPPLNAQLAQDMIRATRVARMLAVFSRMPAADMHALVEALLRVSEMVCELPEIEELDINPLIADEHGVVAVDARIVLRRRQPAARRYAHLAIYPYPAGMAREVRLGDGTPLLVRPIRPEDAELELEFVKGLSESSRYLRFMNAIRELSPAMLARFTQIDYDRDMAFIALRQTAGPGRQVGVVRYVSNPDGSSCEFAVAVADAWQGKGLGRMLLSVLIEAARESRLSLMVGHVLSHNHVMLGLCGRLGFVTADDPAAPGVKIVTLIVRPAV
ncbi:MAG: GNAT family N-acetyltransferase [Betaproteobacteria bacterium RIFCSPLOWO2_02_FULL_62_17]|nr:MAG: GNAT family N-acetyltransferase [Betaproteobacteria bacterium RIFCSPLOWO2_02_FULL_62_17]